MRVVRAADNTLTIRATIEERVWLLDRMSEVHNYFHSPVANKITGMSKVYLEAAWMDLPLSSAIFQKLLGKGYHTFYRNKLKSKTPHRHGTGRLRGHLDPEDIPLMQLVVRAMSEKKRINRDVLDQLMGPDARSSKGLVIKLLGSSKFLIEERYAKTTKDTIDPHDLLSKSARSSDEGYPFEGQGTVERENSYPLDELLGHSKEIPKFAHVGPTPAPERTAHVDLSTNQVQTRFLDQSGTGDEDVPESEREFLALADIGPAPEVEGVDESGDSYLEDIGFQNSDDPMAGFQPWEQDVD